MLLCGGCAAYLSTRAGACCSLWPPSSRPANTRVRLRDVPVPVMPGPVGPAEVNDLCSCLVGQAGRVGTDRPSGSSKLCDDLDAVAWSAGPVVAARSRPCPRERFMWRASGSNGLGAAVWFDRAHLWGRPSQFGVSGPAARPRLRAPPAGGRPGRGPVAARRDDREHPHPRRRPLLFPARTGPVCAGRRGEAGRPALSSGACLAHAAEACPRQHQLR